MRAIRAVIFACMLLAFFGANCQRATAQKSPADERLEVATELFSLMTKDFMDQLMSQMMAKSWSPVEEKLRGSVDRVTMNEIREELMRIVEAFMGDVMQEYPPLYAKYFTTRE